MSSASDWLTIAGYLLLFSAALYAAFQLLPAPEPEGESSAPRRRRKAPVAPVTGASLDDWARAADEAEGYAPGHARRVADLAVRLAAMAGMPEGAIAPLEQAALLHDVGEIGFEPALLSKPGPLNQAELYRVWHHPVRGARKALELTQNQAVAQWVRWHHERWDGLGYPDGLAGEQIPLAARILRLADTADAMLQARPYRGAHTPEEVASEINRLSGVAYDPALVSLFVDDVLPRYWQEQELAFR